VPDSNPCFRRPVDDSIVVALEHND
jgi:hypothetical protein